MPYEGLNDSGPYCRMVPKMFEGVRKACGDEVELLHDIHERIHPIEAINLIKAVEQYRPFFIEDPFAPEDVSPVGYTANAHIDLAVWN